MLEILYLHTETEVNQNKVSTLLPFIKIIALQQRLNITRYKHMKKAIYILKQSIINN
jgi:hypothetical protein